MSDQLTERDMLPCPFCGGQALLGNGECGIDGMSMHARRPYCSRCGTDQGYCESTHDAVASWNHRPDYQSLKEENERLRKALGPFARFEAHSRASYLPHADEDVFYTFNEVSITVGDLRRARTALNGEKTDEDADAD